MKKNRLIMTGIGIIIAASCVFSGCAKKKGIVRLEKGDITENSVVMKIGNTGVKYSEVRNYCYLLKNQYEGKFGEQLWNYKLSDKATVGDEAKQEIVNMITQLKVIKETAEDEGVSLSNEEKDEAVQDAEELMAKASEEDKKNYFLSVQSLAGLYEDNILANKMFYFATDEADTDISDDEAKQISIQYIEVITNGKDQNGTVINMDSATKTKALKRAEKIRKEALKAEDFQVFAEDNSDCAETQLICGRDTDKLDKKVVDAAFNLKKGDISSVIEGDSGYYIVYCVNDYDEDSTYARKEEIIEERQTSMFKDKYAEWLDGDKVSISSKFWNEFEI